MAAASEKHSPLEQFEITKFSFSYFFIFELYFEAWEHQNRTRHETKMSRGSYFHIFLA